MVGDEVDASGIDSCSDTADDAGRGRSIRISDNAASQSSVGQGGGVGCSSSKRMKKERIRLHSGPSVSAPQVYSFVQTTRKGSPKLLPCTVRKGTRRPPDPRLLRAKMVEAQLNDLTIAEGQSPATNKTKSQSHKGVDTELSDETLPARKELAEALQNLVIVSADGGRRWPVDRGGRIVLTSCSPSEQWWQGYPEGALVSGPEEAGDIPREVVIRVSEKVKSEAEGATKAATFAANTAAKRSAELITTQTQHTDCTAEPSRSDIEPVGARVVDPASAAAFRVAAEAVVRAKKSYNYDEQLALGLQRIHAHRYREAIVNFKRCHALEPSDPASCYNLACCYSLLRLTGLAVRWLSSAVDLGLVDGGVLLQDTDLDNIRDCPRFRQLQQRLHRETTIVRPAVSGGCGKDEEADLRHIKFAEADEESEEEIEVAAELVDAHLLGLPVSSASRGIPDLCDRDPVLASTDDPEAAAGSEEESVAPTELSGHTESDASTEVSAQTESEDEAEAAQVLKAIPRNRSKQSKLKPKHENRISDYHGVSWNVSSRLWHSQLPFQGQLKFLGQYDDESEAARAHDDAAHEMFGADVHCNSNGIDLNYALSCGDCRTWGQACMAAGEPQEAVDWFEQALQDSSQPSDEERPMVAYELAGCYATSLDSSLAINWLSNAIQWGLGTTRAASKLEPHTEAVFASLWQDARFLTLCAKLDDIRNGPARKEHTRLVRRHRAARASACVTSAVVSTTSDSDGKSVDHLSLPTIDATKEPKVREAQVQVDHQERELDLFFEFWRDNASAMSDLFGRLATRLVPLDLIRTTLQRVIGGLNLKTPNIEECILNMLGLGSGGTNEQHAFGTPGPDSLFQTDIERVSRVASTSATPGIKSDGVKMSASARHQSLKTEVLCRATGPNQLPQGKGATVPVVARVVDRDEFLSRCAGVAAAWSSASSRGARNEWLQEFETSRNMMSRYPSIQTTDYAEATVSSDAKQLAQMKDWNPNCNTEPHEVAAIETPISHAPASRGLAAIDVNMPRGQDAQQKHVAVVHSTLQREEVSTSGGPLAGHRRWQDASDGLPQNVRRDWTVSTVSAWLRALGLSDSAVGRAYEANIDGRRLLEDAENPDQMACTRMADVLGLRTLGTRKLLCKAMCSLARKADRLAGDSSTSLPRPLDADAVVSFDSSPTPAEEDFLHRLNWPSAETADVDQETQQENDPVAGSFQVHRRVLSSQQPSPHKFYSFGDVSSITTGL